MASSNIDKRVVEMDFDNARFEKNVNQSIGTLDKLKQALNMNGAAKGFDQLEKQANAMNFSKLEASIANIEHRFSALGIAGATVVSNLTNKAIGAVGKLNNAVFGQMKSGGISRALNLEHANFMLEGLLKDSEKVAEIMGESGPVQKAVKGTAYGLDAAAKAASQFVASGVTDLGKLENALTGISGVAAMTSSSYEDISSIFTTVAGQGKVMTMQLRQIEARGLNAAAALGEYLKKSEEEVRDMVTKGKISFETFSEAMNSAFGDQAKKANETFNGAISNVKAALSRIGAKVATPALENLRKMFVSLIEVVNTASKILDPFIEIINNVIASVTGGLTNAFTQLDKIQALFENVMHIAGYAVQALYSVIVPIKRAFESLFPKKTIDDAINFTGVIRKFVKTLTLSGAQMVTVTRIFRGVFGVFDILGQILSALIRVILPATNGVSGLARSFVKGAADIGDYIYAIAKVLKQTDALYQFFEYLKKKIINFKDTISGPIGFVINLFDKLFDAIKKKLPKGNFFDGFTESVKKAQKPMEVVGNVFSVIFGALKKMLEEVSPLLSSFAQMVGKAFGEIGNGFNKAFSGGGFKTLISLVEGGILASLGVDLAYFINNIVGTFSRGIGIIASIRGVFLQVSNSLKVFQMSMKADVLMKIAKAIGLLTASILVLSLINVESLAKALGSITILFVELVAVMTSISKLNGTLTGAASIWAVGSALTSIGISVLLLAGALKIIASIDEKALTRSMIALTVMVIEMVDAAILLKTVEGKIQGGSIALIALAAGVRILAKAVEVLGAMDLWSLIKGVGATVVALYALASAALIIGMSDFGIRSGLGIIAMAAALNIVASAVQKFGNLNLPTLAKGLISMGLALAIMSATMITAGFAKHTLSSSIAIGILSVSLLAIGAALEKIGNIDLWSLIKGLGGVAVSLALMSGALLLLSVNAVGVLGAAAAIAIVAASMNLLIPIITTFASMNLGQLIISLVGFAGCLAIMAAAGTVFGLAMAPLLTGALVITALGAACLIAAAGVAACSLSMGLLVSAFETLSTLSWVDLLSGIAKFVITLAAFAATAMLFGPGILILVALSAALIGVGGACMIMAASITVAAFGTSMMAEALKKFEDISWEAIGKGILALVGSLLAIGACALVLAPLSVVIFILGTGVAALGVGLLACSAAITLFVTAMHNMGITMDDVENAVMRIVEGIATLVGALWNVLLELLGKAASAIVEFVTGFWKGIVNIGAEIVKFIIDLGAKMLKALGVPEDWVNAAANFMKGLVDGIASGIKFVIDKVKEVANGMIDAIKGILKINSPSKIAEWIGQMFGIGISKGVDDEKDTVTDSVEEVGTAMKDQAEEDAKDAKESGELFDTNIADGVSSLKDEVVAAVADVGAGMIDQANADAEEVKKVWSGLTQAQIEGTRSEDRRRYAMLGYNNIQDLTKAGQAGLLDAELKRRRDARAANAVKAEKEENKSAGGNSKATKANTKAKEENKKANDEKTKAINEESEALDEETAAVEDNEQAIRDQAEQIEIVTEKFKDYLKAYQFSDPMKSAKGLTKTMSKLWTTEDKSLSSVTKTYKKLSKSMSNSINSVRKQVVKFDGSGKYVKTLSDKLYKNVDKIEKKVLKSGKTIMKVNGASTKVFYKVGNTVEKMTIRTTKNIKKLGKQFNAARNFLANFNDEIEHQESSEDFILNLRNIEKYFGATKFGKMADKAKNYLRGIVDQFSEVNNSMNILAKNIDGIQNVTSKNSKATAFVADSFLALAATLYDGSDAANEYATEHAKLLFLLENGLATQEEVDEHFQSYISRLKETIVEYRKTIYDNLSGSIDIWSKFNKNLMDEGEDLITNIESQIAGYYNWGNMLMELSKRGFDSGIIKMLTDEGVSSFGKAAKLMSMSSDELALFTIRYQQSQAVIETATDTALAAVANAQTRASLRAAAAQGDKTAQAQLKLSKKRKKELMEDAKAVADFQAQYNKLSAKEEKEYLKSLSKDERKVYKDQLKAAKKQQAQLKKAAKREETKRAEKERLKAIIDGIKSMSDYLKVTRDYNKDAKAMAEVNKKIAEGLKPIQETFTGITFGVNDATNSILAFGESLEATGEEGLTYFEEITKRIQKFKEEIVDSIKSVDILTTSFERAAKVSIETIMENGLSQLTANEDLNSVIEQLKGKGYNLNVLNKIKEMITSDRAQAIEYITTMLGANADQIDYINAEYDKLAEQANKIGDSTTRMMAGATSREVLDSNIKAAEKQLKDAEKVRDEAHQKVIDAEKNYTELANQRDTAYAKYIDLKKRKEQLEKIKKTGKLTKAQKKELKELSGVMGKVVGAQAIWQDLAKQTGDAQAAVGNAMLEEAKAQELLNNRLAEYNKAMEELTKYDEEHQKAVDKLTNDIKLRQWFNSTIDSIDKFKSSIKSLSRSSGEWGFLRDMVTDFMKPFENIKEVFDESGNFSVIKSMADLSAGMKPIEDGLISFSATIASFDPEDSFETKMKKMKDALVEYQNTLESSIRSSSDFFSMFSGFSDEDNPLTATNYLEYADSQLAALETWQENLKKLADKGLDKELLEKFASQGLGSYEQVNAWVNATEAQIGEYNKLWKDYNKSVANASETALAAIGAAWSSAGQSLQEMMIEAFGGNSERFKEMGYESSLMIITGVKDGLANAMPEIISAVEQSTSSTAMASVLGKEVGTAINSGLTAAISSSVTDTVNAAIEKFKMAVDFVNLYVQETLNTDFTITVHVDTSEIDAAVARMNNAIYSINAQAGTTSQAVTSSQENQAAAASTNVDSGTVTNNNVTYNQTINSPTAMNQVEIYRESQAVVNTVKNTLAMSRG